MIARALDGLPLAAWLAAFRLARRYHRYEVAGFEHLVRPGAALLVGYHGRPVAYDLCMLGVTIHEHLGYLPHGVVHRYVEQQPVMKWVSDRLGLVTRDGAAVERAVERGEHILVQPGGTREGCRSFRHRYRVDWGHRMGYLRLALRHRLPIIPIAASGVDDGYLALNDGYHLGKRVGMPGGLPLWLGIGPLGPWPLSPPFPVKIRQLIGAPIALPAIDPEDPAALAALHRRVAGAVQRLLDDRHRGPTP
jgi:1-acyl-sn-glycerol-3-phosphate acyltransferase